MADNPITFVNPLFLIAWLPLVTGAFLLACRYRTAAAPIVLLVASLLFCFANDTIALVFLCSSILANFGLNRLISRTPGTAAKSWLVAIGIVANLLPLAILKLSQDGLSAFAALPASGGMRSAVPLGLAFYTLQQITYLVDASRAGAQSLGFVRYAAWISFFGQLPAGPIATYARMAPQYARLGLSAPTSTMIAQGTTLILAGIVKKIWLADPIGRIVDAIFAGGGTAGVTPFEAWVSAWGFMLQLYFDFSAYSDIAIGVGLCFGLLLPINFDSPLKSATPGQYVQRWHITLMSFVRDYVFQPVFQQMRKLPIRPTSRRYALAWALATLAAFMAVSAWHTLAWLPLVEGICVALVIIGLQILRQWSGARSRPASQFMQRGRRLAAHLSLLIGVSFFALLLRADSHDQVGRMLPALLDVRGAAAIGARILAYLGSFVGLAHSAGPPQLLPNAGLPGGENLLWLGLVTFVALACPNTMQMFGIGRTPVWPQWIRWRPSAGWGWVAGALLFIALLGMTQPAQKQEFVYARF